MSVPMALGYVTSLESEVPASDGFLVAEELEVLSTLRIEKRRREWRHGRWTAKRALDLAWQREHGCPPPRWLVRAAADGAPEAYFADGGTAPFRLSLSHAGGLAMAAVASLDLPEIGCDVEYVEPRSQELIDQFFTADERTLLAESSADPALLACLIWSAKESALKALRTGLRADTRSVSVSVTLGAESGTWQPLEVRHVPTGRIFAGHFRTHSSWVLTLVGTSASEPVCDLAAR